MKRSRVNKPKKNDKEKEHDRDETVQSEEGYKVQAIVSVRKSKKSGYEALIKWEGYKYSDNTWEHFDDLCKDWGLEETDICTFLDDNKIDITKCEHFDFKTMTTKKKQKSTKKKKSSIENKAESPKTIGICSKSHKVIDGNFKPEPDGNYAKEGYYLFQQTCEKCSSVFVPSGGSGDDEFRVTFNTPCYVCESMNCSYYLCAFCYTDEMLKEEGTGRGKRTRRSVN